MTATDGTAGGKAPSPPERQKISERLLKFIKRLQDAGAITLALTLLGGFGTAIWTLITYRDQVEKEYYIRNKEREAAATNHLQSALSNLSADKAFQRISAIYTLRQIARNQPEHQDIVIDFLSTVVRRGRSEHEYLVSISQDGIKLEPVSKEIQVAIRTLNDIKPPQVPSIFSGSMLVSADFSTTTKFGSGTSFRESKLLSADFSDSTIREADFRGAEFNDYVSYGVLNGQFNGFQPCQWMRNGLSMRWARWRYGAKFINARAEGARFDGAGLTGAIFTGAHLKGAIFVDANVSGADFTGASDVDLTGACSDGETVGATVSRPCGGPDRCDNQPSPGRSP